jgi:hypothetical protein
MTYHVQPVVNLTRRGEYCVELTSAVVALTGLTRLERALAERDAELRQLRSAIAVLESSSAREKDPMISCNQCEKGNCNDGFNHNEDLFARKEELARRLKKVQRQKEDMSAEISKERKARYAAEAGIALYSRKILSYRNRLRKYEHDIEALDNSYKAAIEYLTKQMDEANQPRRRDRNSIDTVVLLSQADSRFGGSREAESSRPPLQPAVFRSKKNREYSQSQERAGLEAPNQRPHAQSIGGQVNDPNFEPRLGELHGEIGDCRRRSSRGVAVDET